MISSEIDGLWRSDVVPGQIFVVFIALFALGMPPALYISNLI